MSISEHSAALANGVTRIYTYNREHFTHFEDIPVLAP